MESPRLELVGEEAVAPLEGPGRYINRELSWLCFNERVLEEALDDRVPLLERVRFLAIFGSNLDEFFMIRVSGLRRQLATGVVELPPDGMSAAQQLSAIRQRLMPLFDEVYRLWHKELKPGLAAHSVRLLSYDELKKRQRKLLRRHFEREVFPVLTPLAFDPGHPFPHISNLSLNLAVVVKDSEEGEKFARLKVPATFPRWVAVPDEDNADELGLLDPKARNFVLLEEVVAANLDLLFPGLEIIDAHPFRVTRDADFEIEDDEASDLLTAMAEVVGQRHFGSVVRLEVDEKMPERIRDILVRNLGIAPYQVYTLKGPIGLRDLASLADLELSDLHYPPFQPEVRSSLATDESLFSVIRRQDLVLYHPYDSFSTVVEFVRAAAQDPDVLAIKQTLYRVGANSPIVKALKEARENGKQVSALVELKARFDEQNNISWARALEQAGVHVVYGLIGLKTHAKMCLVIRRESEGMRLYVHTSTGNYNPLTSRVYTDIGFFTCDSDLAQDVADLFNALTGYSKKQDYCKLLVAPGGIRRGILERIEREIEAHAKDGKGHLIFKINAISDKPVIDALYRASQAGVRVDLQVRGICCLRPGVPGLSDTITTSSIVGRFLEHSRLFYFRNGGDEELLAGSADLMQRNLDRRVELLFPIEDEKLRAAIRDDILELHLNDRAQARFLGPDGAYTKKPAGKEKGLDSQRHLLEHGGRWRGAEA